MKTKPLRILMIAPQPFFTPRGTPFSEYYRIRALTGLGHQVDLVTYHVGRDVTFEGLTIHRTTSLDWIRHVPIGPSPVKILLDILVFLRAFSLLRKQRFDLLHTHEEAVFMGVFFRWFFNIPHLYDMHSDLAQQMGNFSVPGQRILSRILRKAEQYALKRSDFVIGICESLGETISALNPAGDHIIIENSPLPYDPGAPARQLEPGPEARSLTEAVRPLILYTGTFEIYQGLHLLLDAADQYIGTGGEGTFVLVGGTEAQIGLVRTELQRRNLTDRVILVSQRPVEDMPAYLEQATILVSPRSSGTNTPLKIYSYLAAGKPILATDMLTHTQVLSHETALLVKPDAGAIAEGLLQLSRSKKLRDDLGRAAREYYHAELSDERYVAKVQTAIASTIASWETRKQDRQRTHYSRRIYQQKEFAAHFDAERFGTTFGKMLSRMETDSFFNLLAPAAGLSILDAGGGTGRLALPLLEQGADIVLLDASPEMMTIAREKATAENLALKLVCGSVDALPFDAEVFDWVISTRVIMHIPAWRTSIREFCRTARQGVIFDFPPMIAFPALAVPVLRLKRIFDPKTQHYHVIHVNKMVHELEHLGFDVIKVERRFFLPVAVHRKLNNPRLTHILERVFRLLGLTSLAGAPATICAIRRKGARSADWGDRSATSV